MSGGSYEDVETCTLALEYFELPRSELADGGQRSCG
jgi:hypothetical protein